MTCQNTLTLKPVRGSCPSLTALCLTPAGCPLQLVTLIHALREEQVRLPLRCNGRPAHCCSGAVLLPLTQVVWLEAPVWLADLGGHPFWESIGSVGNEDLWLEVRWELLELGSCTVRLLLVDYRRMSGCDLKSCLPVAWLRSTSGGRAGASLRVTCQSRGAQATWGCTCRPL